MVRLTEVQRGQEIALLMQGQRQQQVARHFGVHVSTIERLVRRLSETGRVADRPRSGRPRVTSQRQDRAIRLAHLRNRHLTATETAVNTVGSHNRRIHPKTVRNRLREFGLRACRPNVGLPLNRASRARRMAWVTAHAPRRFPMRQRRRFSSQLSPGSPFFVLTGDVVCTDVVGNGLPTLAFSRGIDMGEGRLWYGEGFRMV